MLEAEAPPFDRQSRTSRRKTSTVTCDCFRTLAGATAATIATSPPSVGLADWYNVNRHVKPPPDIGHFFQLPRFTHAAVRDHDYTGRRLTPQPAGELPERGPQPSVGIIRTGQLTAGS